MDLGPHRTITEAALEVVQGFKVLLYTLAAPSCEAPGLPAPAVEDEVGRFRVWAANIGAFQPPTSSASLDCRLHEAPQIREQVMKILARLLRVLQGATSIASGTSINRVSSFNISEVELSENSSEDDGDLSSVSSSGSPVAEGFRERSEISELQKAMHDTITNLFKLSIVIRRPTPRGRYAESKSMQPFDEKFDIAHVWHKFEHIRDADCQWLVERLGKAITRRREYFRYRREHKRKLANQRMLETQVVVGNDDPLEVETQQASQQEVTHKSESMPTVTHTKATTFINKYQNHEVPPSPEDNVSQTTYATTTGDIHSQHELRVPDPEDVIEDGMPLEYSKPFECPYCFTVQIVNTIQEWRRHVFRDLQPYICTFKTCNSQLFSTRHAWFQHELQSHRKNWRCNLCTCAPFQIGKKLEEHMRSRHAVRFTEVQLRNILQSCEALDDKFTRASCPLCRDWKLYAPAESVQSDIVYGTNAQFQRHLGKHLEQLALFALPRPKPTDRSSSYRLSSSSPSEAPKFAKAVHFNENIEDVRHFLQVDRPMAVSAGSTPLETYDSSSSYPFSEGDRSEWEIKLANFPAQDDSRMTVPVKVERLFLSSDSKRLVGTVAVSNLAFEKTVVARFTLDYWKTTSEVRADYRNDMKSQPSDGYDRFNFNIKLAEQANLQSKTLLLCVRYNVNGEEHWDNNGGMNYQVDFIKKMKAQKKREVPIRALPRSRPRQRVTSNVEISQPPLTSQIRFSPSGYAEWDGTRGPPAPAPPRQGDPIDQAISSLRTASGVVSTSNQESESSKREEGV